MQTTSTETCPVTGQQVTSDQYARALTRAQRLGLRVAGRGIVRATGERCMAVSSGSTPNLYHVVAVGADALRCDCIAATHGRYCAHRALAHEHLRTCVRCQRESASTHAEAAATPADDALAQGPEAARRARIRDTAPLQRSNAPISIYRSEM